MKTILKLIALALLTLVIVFTYINKASAGGPWSDQYCNIDTTTIKVVDQNGKIIDERTEEKVVCSDGVKDFLHESGIAKSCQIYTWYITLGNVRTEQRAIACEKMNGEYEIVQGYHSID